MFLYEVNSFRGDDQNSYNNKLVYDESVDRNENESVVESDVNNRDDCFCICKYTLFCISLHHKICT